MKSTKSKTHMKKGFMGHEEINQLKENQLLRGNTFLSSNESKQNINLKRSMKQNEYMIKKVLQGDIKLKYVTKVHLERIPLQNLLNYQRNSEAIPRNICHNVENKRGDIKIPRPANATRKSDRIMEINNIIHEMQDKIVLNKGKAIKFGKSNGSFDTEKQNQDIRKTDKSLKEIASRNENNKPRESMQSSVLVTTNRNKIDNSNNTLKTPVYKQLQMQTNDKDYKDEYDFIVSPSNTRHKLKKRRRNNRAQTPVSFHLFSVPKFTKKKPRKRREFPRTFQAFLKVSPKKGTGAVGVCKSNFLNNYSSSTLINNNKELILPKPETNLGRVIADIKGKIKNNEKGLNSMEQEIPQNIQHDNEDYNSGEINSVENFIDGVEPLVVDSEPQKNDKTMEEEIVTCFGFDDDNKIPIINSNKQENPSHVLSVMCTNVIDTVKSPSISNRTSNKKVKVHSDILIKSPTVPFNKAVNRSSSLFETSNSILKDTGIFQNADDSLQSTINNSLSFDHLPKKGPGANSTMIRPLDNEKSFSWRLDEHLFQRNPHFLMLKQSSLPSTDQEIIIDHTFEDSICQSTKKTIQNNDDKNPEKPVVQKSILDFVESSGKRDIESNVKRVSFFNIDELSPLKDSQQQNLPERNSGNVKRNIFKKSSPKKNSPSNKENVNSSPKRRNKKSPTKYPSFNNFNKENSFSEKENSASSVIKNLAPIVVLKKVDLTLLREKKLNLTNDFGFDSLLIDDEIFKNREKKQAPARISIKEIKKVLTNNNSDNKKTKATLENSPTKTVNDSDSDNDVSILNGSQQTDEFSNNKIDVGLFEDPKLDPKPTSKKYERKRPVKRKNVRFFSKDSDSEHSVVCAPKKKKKDVISKEEEKEFEKWAAAFNSECEEVDKFDLEIV